MDLEDTNGRSKKQTSMKDEQLNHLWVVDGCREVQWGASILVNMVNIGTVFDCKHGNICVPIPYNREENTLTKHIWVIETRTRFKKRVNKRKIYRFFVVLTRTQPEYKIWNLNRR